MITVQQYFGPWIFHEDATPQRMIDANVLVDKVNGLTEELELMGVKFPINPATGSQISGQTYGGFRPQSCPQGAPDSSHKQGQGVDIYDPKNEIDDAITDQLLITHDLYREHPSATISWSHWTTRAPHSNNRTFFP